MRGLYVLSFFSMRYFYKKPNHYTTYFGITYYCNHPCYDSCTLYLINDKGLAVIQQREIDKLTVWGPIDPWLSDYIFMNVGFREYFDKYSRDCQDGLYPTVSIRQIMWALRMKPLKREPWETCFDKCPF